MSALAARIFIAQETLEAWLDAGTASLDAEVIYLASLGQSYAMEPAVRFLDTIPEGESSRMLSRVLSESRLEAAGGELLGDSVIFGDQGFSVETGYIAELRESGG